MNTLVRKVLDVLAEADGVETGKLDYQLYRFVDPDVFLRLSETNGPWQFTFQVSDHQVTITHDEQIRVDGINHSSPLSPG